MTLKVRFTLQRPDTNAEFWWNSTNPEILNYCNKIKEMAQNLGIQHSYAELPNALESVSTFTVENVLQWNQLTDQIAEHIPDMPAKRLEYYTINNHSLIMEWIDETDNTVVFKNTNILLLRSGATF